MDDLEKTVTDKNSCQSVDQCLSRIHGEAACDKLTSIPPQPKGQFTNCPYRDRFGPVAVNSPPKRRQRRRVASQK